MTTGSPDYTKMVKLLGVDADGNLLTIRLDGTGRIEALMKGEYEDTLKTMSLDDEGRMLTVLYGMYEGSPKAVMVDSSGRLSITEMSQTDIGQDSDETQAWSDPLVSLLSNLNRIRWSIVQMSGEAWGTVSHSIATIWGKFHATTGHKHTGGANDGPNMAASAISSGQFPLGRMPRGADGHLLTGTGAGSNPAYEASILARVTQGSYSGNGTANRAIAHGLGITPKMVMITNVGAYIPFRIHGSYGAIFYVLAASQASHTVTAASSTNFYVGNATSYPNSANNSGTGYYWVAFG